MIKISILFVKENVVWLFVRLTNVKFQSSNVFITVEEFLGLSKQESKETVLWKNHLYMFWFPDILRTLLRVWSNHVLHSLHRYSLDTLNQRSNDALWRYCLHILLHTGWLYLQGQHADRQMHAHTHAHTHTHTHTHTHAHTHTHTHTHSHKPLLMSSEHLKSSSLFLSNNTPFFFNPQWHHDSFCTPKHTHISKSISKVCFVGKNMGGVVLS